MIIVAKTDKGNVRNDNQDSYAAGEFSENCAWAVVCDGMGGASGGNLASALAVKAVSEKISRTYREDMNERSIKNMLEAAFSGANLAIFDMAVKNPVLSGMGTTIVCAIVRDSSVYVAHVGDSRAYLISKENVLQLTTDHSIVQNMVDKGQITSDEAKVHPNKNIITRALGVENRVQVDFDKIDLSYGQSVLLCTDGLTNFIESDEILDLISDGKEYAFADRLVMKANEKGGGDNITVVIIAK